MTRAFGFPTGVVNAVRHAVWMALISKFDGPTFAQQLGRAHEQDNFGFGTSGNSGGCVDVARDTSADRTNNEFGRRFATGYRAEVNYRNLLQFAFAASFAAAIAVIGDYVASQTMRARSLIPLDLGSPCG